MPRAVSKPGPPPTSCLTCRRRRKKCDQSKPYCKRCLKGGYECLGYEDLGRKPCTKGDQGRTVPAVPADSEPPRSKTLGSVAVDLFKGRGGLTDSSREHDPRPSILGVALLYRINRPISSANDDNPHIGSSEDFDRVWPQEQTQLSRYSHPPISQSSDVEGFSNTASEMPTCTGNNLREIIQTRNHSMPRSVDASQMMSEAYSSRVMNEYYLQRVRFWFTTPPASVRSLLATRFKGSKATIWAMHLGTRLFQALSQYPGSQASQRCVGWIDTMEQKLRMDYRCNLPVSNIADRLTVQLELAFLKFTAVDTAAGYILLRNTLPRFLQLVATDTSLYMEHPSGSVFISFFRTLTSTRNELQRFVMYDTAAALVLGIPPLVEYGYDQECDTSSYVFEWIHGVPLPLIEVISQVNSCRAGSKAHLGDWETLERRVLAWQSPYGAPDKASTTDCTGMARAAVQESWRHAVLIYIYMGICGVSSHDSRVQASVHQIIQFGETMVDLPIKIHMFAHCVIAGLAARLEKHRVLVNNMLLSFNGAGVWMFRGPQFSQVLCHLWHGTGEGGAAVVWVDYVQSRNTVMPI